MGSPIGFHYMPNHRYERYRKAMAGANVCLILDGSKEDYLDVRHNMGGGRIILRSYEWSDGGLSVHKRIMSDPVGTGRWMAENWIRRLNEWGVVDRDNTYVTGCNEYTVIPGMPIAQFVVSEKTFMQAMAIAGYKSCIGNLGDGHPAELKSDGTVDWEPFREWEKPIQQTGSILGVHEYWRGELGPEMDVKPVDKARGRYWHVARFRQCPFDVPIVVTEWGIDQKVNAPMGTPSKGWVGTVETPVYMAQQRQAINMSVVDPRFCGTTIFCADYASDEWATYDVDRCLGEMVALMKQVPQVGWYKPGAAPQPKPPVPTPVPPASAKVVLPLPPKSYYITQHFDLDSGEIHQGVDLGAVQGTHVLAVADGVVAYVGDHREETPKPFNGGYGRYIRVWHAQLQFHSFYAHLHTQEVKAGDRVSVGQRIGTVGTTGNSTGNHLHFEYRACDDRGTYIPEAPFPNGRVDPESMMALHRLSFKAAATSVR